MFIKKINLAEDPVVRYTASQTPVLSLRGGYSYGWGDNKKTGRVQADIWGDRALKLESMFHKGDGIVVYLDDVYADAYISKNDGSAQAKICGKVVSFEFAGSKQRRDDGQSSAEPSRPAQQNQPAPQQQSHQNQSGGGGFDDSYDPDIPF